MQYYRINWKIPRSSSCSFVRPKCTKTYLRASVIPKIFRGLYPRTFWQEERPLSHPPPLSIQPHAWTLRTPGSVDPDANFSRTHPPSIQTDRRPCCTCNFRTSYFVQNCPLKKPAAPALSYFSTGSLLTSFLLVLPLILGREMQETKIGNKSDRFTGKLS